MAAESEPVDLLRRTYDHKGGGILFAHDVAQLGIEVLFYGRQHDFFLFARKAARAFQIGRADAEFG